MKHDDRGIPSTKITAALNAIDDGSDPITSVIPLWDTDGGWGEGDVLYDTRGGWQVMLFWNNCKPMHVASVRRGGKRWDRTRSRETIDWTPKHEDRWAVPPDSQYGCF